MPVQKRKRVPEGSATSRESPQKIQRISNSQGSNGRFKNTEVSDTAVGEDQDENDSADETGGSEDGAILNEEERGLYVPHKGTVPSQSVKNLPSAQELKAIFEAGELFKSNAFKLQIDSLLPTVVPKTSKTARAPLETFLMQLHDHLTNSKTFSADKAENPALISKRLRSKGVEVPFPLPAPTENTKWTFKFERPEKITVVGSWANEMSVKHKEGVDFGVDLAVEMPNTTFQEKDYLNDRFFHKRALYLAHLAIVISKKFPVELQFHSILGDIRQTVLVIRPIKDAQYDWSKLHAEIRVIAALPVSSPIPRARCSPTASNLRVSDQNNQMDIDIAPNSITATTQTPHYNNLLSLCQVPTALLLSIHNLKNNIPNFSTANALLRIWANQRGFGRGQRTVHGFESLGLWWACVIGLLVEGEEPWNGGNEKLIAKRRKLGRGLSSYQLFRGALDFLANHDFEKQAIFMKASKESHTFPPESWIRPGRAVFIDPTSTVNLLENVPLGSLDLLRVEAAQTLRLLDDASSDPFSITFLRDLREEQGRFDTVIRVHLDGLQALQEDRLAILDHGSYLNAVLMSMDAILRQALGNRAKSITLLHPESLPRSVTQGQPTSHKYLDIGIILNQEHAFRMIDRGPKVDDDPLTVAAFRSFWGEKADLRRFADGSIQECVAWDTRKTYERAHIPIKIVQHILHRHFNLRKVNSLHQSYDETIQIPTSLSRLFPSASSQSGGYRGAMQAFDDLIKAIKEMDLPLSLVVALPCAEGLRYTSILAPLPIPPSSSRTSMSDIPECASYVEVYDAVLQFEKSAKWPDDLGAIQKLKLAWYENLAKGVMEAIEGTKARVALDSLATPVEDSASLEVILPSGFVFRLRMYHDRERTLLEQILSDKSAASASQHEKITADRALQLHLSRFIYSPRHHASIMNMHHRYIGYSPTVRLVKRWFSSHMLSPYAPPELIELLCAFVFLQPHSQSVPCTGPTGFARVLSFLKEWNWRTEPLLIPIHAATDSESNATTTNQNDEIGTTGRNSVQFSSEKRSKAEKAFKERRSLDPGMTRGGWHIATDQDSDEGKGGHGLDGVHWCLDGNGPNPMIADRIKELAKASWNCMDQGMTTGSLRVKTLFTHSFTNYDFLIHLEPSVLPRYSQSLSADEAFWISKSRLSDHIIGSSQDEPIDLVGFDPTLDFLRDLQRIYGDVIAFFYDQMGGTVIAGSWNPLVRQSKPFRALIGYSAMPEGNKKKGQVVLNTDSILAEMARMGQGMIKEIVKQT